MDIRDCFGKRLLRKIEPDKNKSMNSIKIAENLLEKARSLLDADFFSDALFNAYTSMFHAARSLLYKDGIQEKSHHAVYIYIKDKYSKDISKGLIESFKNHQLERHELIYGFESDVNKKKAEAIIEDAEQFLGKIEEVLNG